VGDFNLQQPVRATFGPEVGVERWGGGGSEQNWGRGKKETHKITANGPIKMMWLK
jgi:hypothetical protein